MANSPHKYNGTGMHFDRYVRDVGSSKPTLKTKDTEYEINTNRYMFSENRCKHQDASNESICLVKQYKTNCIKNIYCSNYVKCNPKDLKTEPNKLEYKEYKSKENEQQKIKKQEEEIRKREEEKKKREKEKRKNQIISIKKRFIEKIEQKYKCNFEELEISTDYVTRITESIMQNDTYNTDKLIDEEIKLLKQKIENKLIRKASDLQKTCSHYEVNGYCVLLKSNCTNNFGCLLYRKK